MTDPLNIILWGVAIFVVLSILSYLLPIIILTIVNLLSLFDGLKEHLAFRKRYKKAVKRTRNRQKEFKERRKRNLENMKLDK